MRKIIVNLVSNKLKKNNTSTCQLTHLQNLLLRSIVAPLKMIYQIMIHKVYMRKVRTYSLKLSSTLFSCSIFSTYNRGNHAQKQLLRLKSYLPGINKSVFPKRHYDNIFLKN